MGEREIVTLERIAAALERSNRIARAQLRLTEATSCNQVPSGYGGVWEEIMGVIDEPEPAVPVARSEETS